MRKNWYNPFDLTKVWPHKDYPLIEVGVLELNRNPENYFAEVEQAALRAGQRRARHRPLAGQDAAGAHLLLCGRASLSPRRQRTSSCRSTPRCPVHSYHRDGADARRRQSTNPDAYYEPNSFGGPMQDQRVTASRR